MTGLPSSDCIGGVKLLVLTSLVLLQCSCTTLVNRRDLYSPEPAPDSMEVTRRATTTTTKTTTTTTTEPEPALPPSPLR